eukprot:5938331-Amphidinium_carterae.1
MGIIKHTLGLGERCAHDQKKHGNHAALLHVTAMNDVELVEVCWHKVGPIKDVASVVFAVKSGRDACHIVLESLLSPSVVQFGSNKRNTASETLGTNIPTWTA